MQEVKNNMTICLLKTYSMMCLICLLAVCLGGSCSCATSHESRATKYERRFDPSSERLLGKRIAYYANSFIGTPYDRIPIGLYVHSRRIIADNEVDCMYLVFRAVELGIANGDNEKALNIGLDKRFHDRGLLDGDGLVMNYDNRYDYGEDMAMSGKYGKSIFTKTEMATMSGTRIHKTFSYIPSERLIDNEIHFYRIRLPIFQG